MIALIPEWKKAFKLASFQIALILIILEALQFTVDFMPADVAQVVRGVLMLAFPIARLLKQNIK